MKKSTIWVIAGVMGFLFLALIFLQAKYFEEVINMRKEQFDESVTRSLYQAARNLELNETKRGLERRFGKPNASQSNDSLQAANNGETPLKQECGRTFRPMCQRDCFSTT